MTSSNLKSSSSSTASESTIAVSSSNDQKLPKVYSYEVEGHSFIDEGTLVLWSISQHGR